MFWWYALSYVVIGLISYFISIRQSWNQFIDADGNPKTVQKEYDHKVSTNYGYSYRYETRTKTLSAPDSGDYFFAVLSGMLWPISVVVICVGSIAHFIEWVAMPKTFKVKKKHDELKKQEKELGIGDN